MSNPTGDALAAAREAKVLETFIADMSESIGFAKATDRQREVGKAWLRLAITYARQKARERSQ